VYFDWSEKLPFNQKASKCLFGKQFNSRYDTQPNQENSYNCISTVFHTYSIDSNEKDLNDLMVEYFNTESLSLSYQIIHWNLIKLSGLEKY